MSEKLIKVLVKGDVDAYLNLKHITHVTTEKEGWTVHREGESLGTQHK